ncbi:hypothetical protein AAMO2058_000921300 [Amorphochlora amoebiformis]
MNRGDAEPESSLRVESTQKREVRRHSSWAVVSILAMALYSGSRGLRWSRAPTLGCRHLKATRADGFHHGHSYDPRKSRKQNLRNQGKYHYTHGINQFQRRHIIRFEMPFNVYCVNCVKKFGWPNRIKKGERFNAKKKYMGAFGKTKIYEFRMACYKCGARLKVRTNPKNCSYQLVQGLSMAANKKRNDEFRAMDERRELVRANPFMAIDEERRTSNKFAEEDRDPMRDKATFEKVRQVRQAIFSERKGLSILREDFRNIRNGMSPMYKAARKHGHLTKNEKKEEKSEEDEEERSSTLRLLLGDKYDRLMGTTA